MFNQNTGVWHNLNAGDEKYDPSVFIAISISQPLTTSLNRRANR